jgi:vancomycin resistance protein YoaR
MNQTFDDTQRIRIHPTEQTPSHGSAQQILTIMVATLAAFFILLLLTVAIFEIAHIGRIYPGISIGGVNVGGMTREEAQTTLTEQLSFPITGKVIFTDRDQQWTFAPMDLGLLLNAPESVEQAYVVGRGDVGTRLLEQFESLYYRRDLPPVLIMDQRAAVRTLEGLRPAVDEETIEASLSIDGLDVTHTPGQNGRSLKIEDTITVFEPYLAQMQSIQMALVVEDRPAAILDASAEADLARSILSQEFTIRLPDGESKGPWVIDRETLSNMLVLKQITAEDGSSRYGLGVNRALLTSFVGGFAPDLVQQPKDARFIFNDDTRKLEVIQSAVIGRTVDMEMTAQAMESAILEGSHSTIIDFSYTEPFLTDDTTGEKLGIVELVHAETSYFYGSDSARVQNIQTAAAEFHGIMIPPQTTFSMASAMDDVTLDNGYAEAWIIYGDQTIKGVGGGVCQVSTTLFRAAFFAGFPVIERHPHAYRVYYYEKEYGNRVNSQLSGLDATVYLPVVDLKFTNDTDNWLLVETYVIPSSSSITFKFYGTSDGRQVNWSTTGLTNIEPEPDAVYRLNPDLGEGVIKQVDWGIAGGTVTVFREVTRGGTYLFDDSFYTRYQAWRDVYEYGPNTELPEDANIEGE